MEENQTVVFQPEIIQGHSPQSRALPSEPTDTESDFLKSDIKKEIVKLLGEFDMMTLYDYDETGVEKIEQLVEKYQKAIFKLQEKTLEVKTNELDSTKEELQLEKSKNLKLSKRIKELDMAKKPGSSQKKSLKPNSNLNSGSKSEPEKELKEAESGTDLIESHDFDSASLHPNTKSL